MLTFKYIYKTVCKLDFSSSVGMYERFICDLLGCGGFTEYSSAARLRTTLAFLHLKTSHIKIGEVQYFFFSYSPWHCSAGHIACHNRS